VLSLVLLVLLGVASLVALGSLLEGLLLLGAEFTPHLAELLCHVDGGRLSTRIVLLEASLCSLTVELLELHERRQGLLGCIGVLLLLGSLTLLAGGVSLLALLVVVVVVMMVVVTLLVTRVAALLRGRRALLAGLLRVAGRGDSLALICRRSGLGVLLLTVTGNHTRILLRHSL